MARPNKKQSPGLLERFKESESSTSIVFGAIVVIVAGLLLFNFVTSNRQASLSEKGASTEEMLAQNGTISLPTKHMVVKGEHLWKIAEKYYGSGYNWVDIAKANNLKNASALEAGMELSIPAIAPKTQVNVTPTTQVKPTVSSNTISESSYTVKKGDSLWTIAVRSYGDGYKWTSIWKANKKMIGNPNHILVGSNLILPR